MHLGKLQEMPQVLGPCIPGWDQHGLTGSWFHPDPGQAVVDIWGVNSRWKLSLCLSLSALCFSSRYISSLLKRFIFTWKLDFYRERRDHLLLFFSPNGRNAQSWASKARSLFLGFPRECGGMKPGPSSAAFPAVNWIETWVARTWTGAHIGFWHCWQRTSLLCYYASPRW